MANDWTKNPMEIDTAENNAGDYLINYMEWHPNAANDDLEVQDGAGNVLWKIRAIAPSSNDETSGIEKTEIGAFPLPAHGLNVVTIDGGTLYVHLR